MAAEYADKAYGMGYPLPGLRNKLMGSRETLRSSAAATSSPHQGISCLPSGGTFPIAASLAAMRRCWDQLVASRRYPPSCDQHLLMPR